MKLPRKELHAAVTAVKPALATKELIEECCCVWFDGEAVTAFNDTLGIRVPFESEFKGGVRGNLLLGMLDNTRFKLITIEPLSDGNALFTAGKDITLLKLALLPISQAIYELPKLSKDAFIPTGTFWGALKRVSIALGPNLTAPEQLGVSVAPTRAGLALYATDAATLAEATVKADWPQLKKRITIPNAFIDQLIKMQGGGTKLYLQGGGIAALDKSGMLVFSRLVDVPRPTDFAKSIDDCSQKLNFFPKPDRLLSALERASILLATEANAQLNMELIDGQLKLSAKTAFGDLKDNVELDCEPNPTSCNTNPDLIKRALELSTKEFELDVAMSKQVTIVQGKDFRYVVANFQ